MVATLRIALVSCCGKKLSRIASARLLYRSPLFQKSARWVELQGLEWFVISAEHGLIQPDALLGPYERPMRSVSAADRLAWNRNIARELQALTIARDVEQLHVTLLAGEAYAGWIPLVQPWCAVEQPLGGLEIGERLRWLTQATGAETTGQSPLLN